MGGGRRGLSAILMVAVLAAGPVVSQDQAAKPFLVLNQERILTGSVSGQKLLADEAAARDSLRADARAIDSAFEAEEQSLTELRKTLSAEEFRAKANDFDARVVKARQEQDARSGALAQDLDRRRRQFYSSVGPILVTLMGRYNAHAIFDENSVLLVDEALNITEDVIAEIDALASQAVPVPPAPPSPADGLGVTAPPAAEK